MDARLDYFADQTVGTAFKHFVSAGKVLKDSPLPAATQELVALRVSQINGCAVCIDMHTREAAAAGESPVRLSLVAAWREATVFTEAERAALALAEEGTRIADGAGGVGDEVWARAAEHYDEEQLTALVLLASFMNTVNRLNVIAQQPAGSGAGTDTMGKINRPENLFTGFDTTRHAARAREEWPAEAEQTGRYTAALTEADVERMQREATAAMVRMAEFMQAGTPVTDPAVQSEVDAHYRGICRMWTPNAAAFKYLGRTYAEDAQWRAAYDQVAEGLAGYQRDAMTAYADARLS